MRLGYYQIFWENGMNTFEYRYAVEVNALRNEGIITSYTLVNNVNGINLPEGFGKTTAKQWPQEGDRYWFVATSGTVKDSTYNRLSDTKARQECGNFFKEREDAEVMAEKFKKLLNI